MSGRIAFLGPTGTYTEEAALLYDPQAVLEPFPSIPAVGAAVSAGVTEEGVVPIENSLEGSVNFTLDLLISRTELSVRNEIVVPIEHFMFAMPGVEPASIQVIYSHPQALAQCKDYLQRVYPQAMQMASLSTVAAVADMRQSDVPAASISPRRAGELNEDVVIIGQGIQDNVNNVTRFVVLSPRDHQPTGSDKTSICFSFQQRDSSGLLHQALGEFAERKINLMKIESRPTKENLGEYIFLVDCAGHREDPEVAEVLKILSEQCRMLRVFGSYPVWSPPEG
jgi:prephenate dehydratase